MHGSLADIPQQATVSKEQPFAKNNFGTIVRALWPDKPALNLAQRIGCTERGAQYLIDGQRRVTARAVALIVNEIIS